jgi:hypothetical protein
VSAALYIFKLKNDIRHEEEVVLAELELRSLMKGVELRPVGNLADILYSEPLRGLTSREDHLVQDVFLRLPFPGRTQAFVCESALQDISKLVSSLAYFKEIFVATSEESALPRLLPSGDLGCPSYTYRSETSSWHLYRIIPVSALLDYASHIVKKWEIPEFTDQFNRLIEHLERGYHNIPLLSLGREIGDFVDMGSPAGEKYLFHALHTFPGSQFPRMIRALVNVLELEEDDLFLDPHNGGGTMCFEAALLRHRSEGWDVIPLFNLITEAKMAALDTAWDDFDKEVSELLSKVRADLKNRNSVISANNTRQMTEFTGQASSTALSLLRVPEPYAQSLTPEQLFETSVIAKRLGEVKNDNVKRLCQVALSNLLFDIYYRKHSVIVRRRFINELVNISKRLYLWHKILKPRLAIQPADSRQRLVDARTVNDQNACFGGIITSPPYIEAEAYADVASLSSLCLGIGTEAQLEELRSKTIGREQNRQLSTEEVLGSALPEIAKQTIENVKATPQVKDKAATLYAYYVDMQSVLGNLFRVLKNGKRCILVVAEPHFWKIEDEFFFVPNSEILRQLAEKSHFDLEFDIVIPLAKAFKRHRITNGERLLILRKGTNNAKRAGSQAVSVFQKQKASQQQTSWKQSLNQTRLLRLT